MVVGPMALVARAPPSVSARGDCGEASCSGRGVQAMPAPAFGTKQHGAPRIIRFYARIHIGCDHSLSHGRRRMCLCKATKHLEFCCKVQLKGVVSADPSLLGLFWPFFTFWVMKCMQDMLIKPISINLKSCM